MPARSSWPMLSTLCNCFIIRPPALESAPLSWKNRVLSKPPRSQRGVAQPGHFLPGPRGPSAAWDWLLGLGCRGSVKWEEAVLTPQALIRSTPVTRSISRALFMGWVTWSCAGAGRDCWPGWGLRAGVEGPVKAKRWALCLVQRLGDSGPGERGPLPKSAPHPSPHCPSHGQGCWARQGSWGRL